MNELPDFWRTEIWHPLSVHLPLAVLVLATIFLLVNFLIKSDFWEKAGKVFLLIGTIGIWIAIYTGNLADAIVSREICDPTVLKTHESNAYIVGWLFSATSIFIIFHYFGFLKKLGKIIKIIIIILALTGSGFLIYTGHLGATLVYQQAAGVYTPSEDCNEFTN